MQKEIKLFGISGDEPMPQAFLTDHDIWDYFVGDVWASILMSQDADPGGVAIELAPGNSGKIGVALARLNFHGVLYVIDASAAALDALAPKYRALLPDADLRFICSTIHDCQLPENADMLLGNHIIDDMMLSAVENIRGMRPSSEWAASYTHAPSRDVRDSWAELSSQDELTSKVKETVSADVMNAITASSAKLTVLTQYPSATLLDHGMQDLNEQAFNVLDGLKSIYHLHALDASVQPVLNKTKNYGNAHIGRHLLNAAYWMVRKA